MDGLRRRGAKDVGPLLADIARCAEGLARAITRHMAREEAEVLPLLSRSLCHAEQRHMIWRILRAMPLRLLERVMPWVAGEQGQVTSTSITVGTRLPLEGRGAHAGCLGTLERWPSDPLMGDPSVRDFASDVSKHGAMAYPYPGRVPAAAFALY